MVEAFQSQEIDCLSCLLVAMFEAIWILLAVSCNPIIYCISLTGKLLVCFFFFLFIILFLRLFFLLFCMQVLGALPDRDSAGG